MRSQRDGGVAAGRSDASVSCASDLAQWPACTVQGTVVKPVSSPTTRRSIDYFIHSFVNPSVNLESSADKGAHSTGIRPLGFIVTVKTRVKTQDSLQDSSKDSRAYCFD